MAIRESSGDVTTTTPRNQPVPGRHIDMSVQVSVAAPGEARKPGRPSDVGGSAEPRAAGRLLLLTRVVIALVLLAQLAVFIQRSVVQYASGNLGMDFAIFYQAWHQIGAGNLSPFSTITHYPYWQSHFELIMWPLALIGLVFPSGLTLLVLQDLAIVGAEAIALWWVFDVVRQGRSARLRHLVPVAIALGLLVTNHQISTAATSDFHFQAFATLLVLGGARALWLGNKRSAWIWLLAALLTGDVAGLYLAGLGLSAAVARRDTRWTGVGLMATGAGWVVLLGLVGANKGSAIGGYQHLVDHPLPASGGAMMLVLAAIVLHPNRPVAVLWSKAALFRDYLAGAGFLGLLHPWTFGVMAVTLLTSGLQDALPFFSPFQNFPAILFGTTGTAMALDWLGRRSASRRLARAGTGTRAVVQGVVLACVLGVALAVVIWRPAAQAPFAQPAGAAAPLRAVDHALRPDDEVVTGFGMPGRFAGRQHIYMLLAPGALPVDSRRVVFVFSPTIGNMPTPEEQTKAAAAVRGLGARPIVETPDVQAYVWTPPPGTTHVDLP